MEGDRERFGALYQRAYPAILRYAHRRVPPDLAADVAAEVFVVAWRRIADVPEGDALPWLYGVARRVVANQRRGADRAVGLLARVATLVGDGPPTIDPADAVAESMTVLAAFRRLSADDREVLSLVVWEGLGARDAARVLGCSVPAVAARLSRARRRLQANLDQEEG